MTPEEIKEFSSLMSDRKELACRLLIRCILYEEYPSITGTTLSSLQKQTNWSYDTLLNVIEYALKRHYFNLTFFEKDPEGDDRSPLQRLYISLTDKLERLENRSEEKYRNERMRKALQKKKIDGVTDD
ncbi:MAG: hypothetical protein LBP22_08720 [Deltaproteobacteria bacterium]|jgi:hypothetical protein|nr:hypothetical protein [Deltaproteobacteria bacterium]